MVLDTIARQGRAASLHCEVHRETAHLCSQLEGEATVQLREGSAQVEARKRLPHTVPGTNAERNEALRFPASNLWHTLRILSTLLQKSVLVSQRTSACGALFPARM